MNETAAADPILGETSTFDSPYSARSLLGNGFERFHLFISGAQFAEIEPCGCSDPPAGGIARRAATHARLKKESTPVITLEAGNSLFPRIDKRFVASVPLLINKTKAMERYLDRIPHDAIGIGANDLLADTVASHLTGDHYARFLASNLHHPGGKTFRRSAVASLPTGSVVMMLNLFDRKGLERTGLAKLGFTLEDPVKTVEDQLAVAPQCGFVVVINHIDDKETLLALIKKYPQIRVVVDPGSLIPAQHEAKRVIGTALVVRLPGFGTKAVILECLVKPPLTKAGVHDLGPLVALEGLTRSSQNRRKSVPDDSVELVAATARNTENLRNLIREEVLKAESSPVVLRVIEILLTDKVPEDDKLKTVVTECKASLELSPLSSIANLTAPPKDKDPFLVESCAKCHVKEYTRWKGSAHAHAFDTLVKKEVSKRVDCIPCHTTGFQETWGFSTLAEIDAHKHVQCAACHVPVPGKDHPGKSSFLKVSSVTCYECHTPSNSPKFDFESYLRRGTCQ